MKQEGQITIGGQQFPTQCPADCPNRAALARFDQGCVCTACPIFNCVDRSGTGFVLLEPDDYRPDWAKAWRMWFDNGMKDYPELYLDKEQ